MAQDLHNGLVADVRPRRRSRKKPMAKVLLVDDEEVILKVLGAYLRRAGFEIQTTTGVPGALDLLAGGRFDAVVTDLCLTAVRPDEGLDLIQKVRRAYPGTATVLFTGYATASVEEAASAVGTDRVVRKGQGPADVQRALEELLSRPTA